MLTPARRSRHAGHEGSLETLLCTRMSAESLLARAIAASPRPCPATDGLQSCVLAQEWPGVSCAPSTHALSATTPHHNAKMAGKQRLLAPALLTLPHTNAAHSSVGISQHCNPAFVLDRSGNPRQPSREHQAKFLSRRGSAVPLSPYGDVISWLRACHCGLTRRSAGPLC